MKPVFAVLLALGVAAPLMEQSGQLHPRSAVAYISVQRLLAESIDGKAASKRLDTLRQTKAKEFNDQQKALEKTRLDIANAGGLFRTSKIAQLKAQEVEQQTQLQQSAQRAQVELQNLQRELQTDLRVKLETVVADIAKRRSIDLILNQDNAVVWSTPGADLTSEVLDRLNASATSISGGK